MKQLIQYVRSGESAVVDVPAPTCGAGEVLIHTGASLVSAGTEGMVVDFAHKNLLQKARARPDLVRQTIDKVQREGLLATVEAVQNRLDQPMALGYASAGTVIEVGAAVRGVQVGDRVACAGGGHAVHAEVVAVPQNLVVKLPTRGDGTEVPFEEAAFTTLGAIAMQGFRLAEVNLGEVVVVIGLGLLGQLAAQIAKAAGCRVMGLDLQPERTMLARRLGIDATTDETELTSWVNAWTHGHGADAVLITAATPSNAPVTLAGELAREKGAVVAVGTVGMDIPRKPYYEKELRFHVSRSYGPGRYDPDYEEKGVDYPYAYVRWTEQRNMASFAHLLAEGKLNIQALISHRIPIAEGARAYDIITGKVAEPYLGVVLVYPEAPDLTRKVYVKTTTMEPEMQAHRPVAQVRLGLIGAGLFANATLLPALKGLDNLARVTVASKGGVSARAAADRFGFSACTTEEAAVIDDPAVNTVAIVTRNHLHAGQVIAALEAGKHVYVEKPLCLTETELDEIIHAYRGAGANAGAEGAPALMVGYNRRFAPFVVELKRHLQQIAEPLMVHYRVDAGYLPDDHWLHDPAQGGGRLLGEACHFIDLVIHLAGSTPEQVTTQALPDSGRYRQDNLLITLTFANGSIGTVGYLANGDRGLGKECLEVFGGGLSARLDDYRTLAIRHGSTRIQRTARLKQDKGHRGEWQAWGAHLTGAAPAPIAFEEIVTSTAATLAAQRSLRDGEPVRTQIPADFRR